MGLLKRNKEKTNMLDESPELKKGEFKNILLNQMDLNFPDFQFSDYKNQYYQFQKIRDKGQFKINESIAVGFSLKKQICSVSVASRLNTSLRYSSSYNTGWLNPHADLISLKKNRGIIPFNEAYYRHNGRQETTLKMVFQLIEDLKDFGIPFLDKQFKNLSSNSIVVEGLKKIANIKYDCEKLKSEMENEMRESDHVITRLKHPLYLEMKKSLQQLDGASKEERREIPRFAFELIELYISKEQNL